MHVSAIRAARLASLILFAVILSVPRPGLAQQANFVGDYAGMLGQLHVRLHIVAAADGSLSGSIDSLDQNLADIPCANFLVDGQSLSFSVPSVHSTWSGALSADRNTLSGTWTQSTPIGLDFSRIVPIKPAPPAAAGPAGNSDPPCPTSYGVNYLAGGAWKPLTLAAAEQPKKGGLIKNPLKSSGGNPNLHRYLKTAAAFTLDPSPKFCIMVPADYNINQIMIGPLEVKKDDREFEQPKNSDSWFPKNKARIVTVRHIPPNFIEISPSAPLPPGQYVIGGKDPIGIYDFGVGTSIQQP